MLATIWVDDALRVTQRSRTCITCTRKWESPTSLNNIYNAGKLLGVTPRQTPDKPVTPPSQPQRSFQMEGVIDGKTDPAKASLRAPLVKSPPTYRRC
ncbi:MULTISPECIES: hypothetical protein [Burkholderia]|uniref:hypothetical protein n=1 Tax=Burkholderia TaxID=32008 RepID=UPI0012E3823A|nr:MULTISPECIES: hypothetical protein [Burkholderia]